MEHDSISNRLQLLPLTDFKIPNFPGKIRVFIIKTRNLDEQTDHLKGVEKMIHSKL